MMWRRLVSNILLEEERYIPTRPALKIAVLKEPRILSDVLVIPEVMQLIQALCEFAHMTTEERAMISQVFPERAKALSSAAKDIEEALAKLKEAAKKIESAW